MKKKRPATIGQSPRHSNPAYWTARRELGTQANIVAGYLGDRIVVVVQKQRSAGSEATTAAALASKVRRGDIRHAVVVRVKKELQRPDGSLVRFGDNACVLVNKSGDPIGTRMNGKCQSGITAVYVLDADIATGVVGQELRNKKWSKILSLAPIHV